MASKKRLTREHVDKLLKGALPGLLERTREGRATVADLIRMVRIEQILAPVKLTPRKLIWMDGWN